MIWRGLGRIILVIIGFIAALVVGTMIFFYATASWYGSSLGESKDDLSMIMGLGSELYRAIEYVMSIGFARTILPAILVVIVGEVMRLRSPIYYLVAGGLAVLAIPFLVGQAEVWSPLLPNARYMAIFLTAGFGAGFTYWLIAGRRA